MQLMLCPSVILNTLLTLLQLMQLMLCPSVILHLYVHSGSKRGKMNSDSSVSVVSMVIVRVSGDDDAKEWLKDGIERWSTFSVCPLSSAIMAIVGMTRAALSNDSLSKGCGLVNGIVGEGRVAVEVSVVTGLMDTRPGERGRAVGDFDNRWLSAPMMPPGFNTFSGTSATIKIIQNIILYGNTIN